MAVQMLKYAAEYRMLTIKKKTNTNGTILLIF